jgi:N-acetylmuramoyl-L-alanine amidase
VLALVLLTTGCRPAAEDLADRTDELAFSDPSDGVDTVFESTTTTTVQADPTTTTTAPPVPLGSAEQPFVPLPSETAARAVMTPAGIVLPVLGERRGTWMVMTACEELAYVPTSSVSVVPRAHVVLDPGHGGTEVGAVGPQGTTEKDLNLAVALEAHRLLSDLGADVVLTRSSDHNLTTGFRGLLAKSIDPALFVSIHHNGGAPRSGPEPGTIVLTKAGDDESRRFGGLFFEALNTTVQTAADQKRRAHAEYLGRLAAHEATIDAYDGSVQARDAALLANGQITETTLPAPAPDPVDGLVFPRERNPIPTTTLSPPTTTVAVPETLPVPEPFAETPAREFLFAGGGNRGVRSWARADGKDYLSVLRHSADVPAVLAEFLYVTNPSEEELLMDPGFVAAEGATLAAAVVEYFAFGRATGSGFVADQFDDQPIGGGGRPSDCVEPDYRLSEMTTGSWSDDP